MFFNVNGFGTDTIMWNICFVLFFVILLILNGIMCAYHYTCIIQCKIRCINFPYKSLTHFVNFENCTARQYSS